MKILCGIWMKISFGTWTQIFFGSGTTWSIILDVSEGEKW